MKKIFAIAWNDVRIEFMAPATLVFFLALPILFTIVLGATLGGSIGSATGGPNRIALLVADQDASATSQGLIDGLNSSGVVRVITDTLASTEQQFKKRDAPALLVIPAGFGERVLAGQPVDLPVRQETGSNNALAAQQAVSAAAAQVSNAVLAARASLAAAERIRPFESEAAQQQYFHQSLARTQDYLDNPPATVKAMQAPETNVQSISGAEQSSAGELVTWVLITLVGAAEVFVNDRLGGTLRRLVVTPTSKAAILAGKIMGRLGMGIVQMALLIGFGALVMGVNWGKSPLALVIVVLAFGICAVALGVLLGTFVRTRSQASGMVIFTSMMLASLGGAWWPMEITPQIYQQVMKVLPTTWAMQGFTDVIVRGQGVLEVLPVAGILLLYAGAFFAIGIWRFKFE